MSSHACKARASRCQHQPGEYYQSYDAAHSRKSKVMPVGTGGLYDTIGHSHQRPGHVSTNVPTSPHPREHAFREHASACTAMQVAHCSLSGFTPMLMPLCSPHSEASRSPTTPQLPSPIMRSSKPQANPKSTPLGCRFGSHLLQSSRLSKREARSSLA